MSFDGDEANGIGDEDEDEDEESEEETDDESEDAVSENEVQFRISDPQTPLNSSVPR